MNTQQHIDYERIATAIDYIRAHFREQPDLNEIADKLNLSQFHFQRLFREWAGTSPKKFLQYISIAHARQLLRQYGSVPLSEIAFETGLSGTGRLHDLFISIEGMTPADYRNSGAGLEIVYSFQESPFGPMIAAATSRGICYLAFVTDHTSGLILLKNQFPAATFTSGTNDHLDGVQKVFSSGSRPENIKLHLKGSEFQLKVWEALLKIPPGAVTTYASVARHIKNPNAFRAVGTAIGSNPIAYLIPCHRVIQASGETGGYRWGTTRKSCILGWEGAQNDKAQEL